MVVFDLEGRSKQVFFEEVTELPATLEFVWSIEGDKLTPIDF